MNRKNSEFDSRNNSIDVRLLNQVNGQQNTFNTSEEEQRMSPEMFHMKGSANESQIEEDFNDRD